MAKKQKRATPKPAPTKRQLSKWQRQMRIRRIVIIVAVVCLAAIAGWVGSEYYRDRVAPWREVVIKVNDTSFNMGYYVRMLDAYSRGIDPDWIYYMANVVASTIIDAEVIRQHAKNELGIEVSRQEIEAALIERDLPSNEENRIMIRSVLLQKKLEDYFDSRLPDKMEQAHLQVMLVESEQVANEVIAEIKAGGNFTTLIDELSCHPTIEGDLGWLPRELMPNALVGGVAFNITAGGISEPIYDELATKSLGYWLIEVLDIVDEENAEAQVKARAMLLGSRVEAERVRAELVGGNFTSLAKEYSQHKSRDNGGELGWLKKGDMGSEAFDGVAFGLTPNRVSEPVKDESVRTGGGYWMVQVIDRDDERQLEAEAREEMMSQIFMASFERWKEESTVENRLDETKMWWAIQRVLQQA